MTKRHATGITLALLLAGLALSSGPPVSAQMGPGMMGGQGAPGQGQTAGMPMQQMSDVIKQMAERLASRKRLDSEKAERLRRLAGELVAATGRMTGGTGGGMMGGGMMGMMGQGSEQIGEISRILARMNDLLVGQ